MSILELQIAVRVQVCLTHNSGSSFRVSPRSSQNRHLSVDIATWLASCPPFQAFQVGFPGLPDIQDPFVIQRKVWRLHMSQMNSASL